jgi:hypothetical protein
MAFAIKVRLEINSKISPYSYVTIIEIPTRMGDNSVLGVKMLAHAQSP